jgi:hypothetical protein
MIWPLPYQTGTDSAAMLGALRHSRRLSLRKLTGNSIRRPPRHFRTRRRGFAIEDLRHMMETDQDLFRKMFRMSVDSFKDLVDMLDVALARNEAKAIASSGAHCSIHTYAVIMCFS